MKKKFNYYQASVKVGARRFEIFDQIVSIVFVNVKTYVPVILQFSLVFIFYLFIYFLLSILLGFSSTAFHENLI